MVIANFEFFGKADTNFAEKNVRRFYQESWQGIPFTSFSHISFFHLANSKFYSTFYEELFKRYKNWDDLPKEWRENKANDAMWLAKRLKKIICSEPGQEGVPRVLSIGSGVGYMEKMLLELCPDIELYVNEPSTVGMKWLKKIIPAERIFIGLPTVCLPSDMTFDLVYLSAVDYGINSHELERLLEQLRSQLAPGGQLICISASLLQEDSFVGSLVNAMKNVIRAILHYLGIRRQQFWGWRRTQREYRKLFSAAGFHNICDGTLKDGFESYWISGEK